jgi:two-component system cell cycle sensor histidine kinase/response regulator CckA
LKEVDSAIKEFGILDHVPVGVFVLQRDFIVLFWNRCLEDWTQIQRNSIIGKSIYEFFSNLNHPRYTSRIQGIFDGGPPAVFSSQLHKYIIPSQMRDGNLRVQHTTVAPIEALHGEGFYALFVIQDVTDLTCRIQDYRAMRDQALEELKERKRAEKELQKARDELELRVEERTADLFAANERLQREIIEREQAEEVLRESEEKFRSLAEQLPNMIFIRKKGKIVYVNKTCEEITGYKKEEFYFPDFDLLTLIAPEFSDMVKKDFKEYFEGKETPPYEFVVLTKEGRRIDVILTTKLIRYEGENAVLGIVTDITERKKMEEELSKTEKLESVGILAGGIAHDFNNLLTAILGNISLAKHITNPEDSVYERLAEAEKASLRAKDLTKQLLTFSTGGVPVKRIIPISELVMESAKFALRGSDVKCEFFISDDLWPVEVDEGQISQAVQNIIINADYAMPQGGTIHVFCKNVNIGEDDIKSLKGGKYVMISIKDHGVGIPAENLEKIFDPFFTTKEKGSGLGLATTYSIIKKNGGYITVESEVGAGTTFHLYLPASQKRLSKKEKREKRIDVRKGKILVMDDEEMVRLVARTMLKRIGYEVEFAVEGTEAIELYKKAIEMDQPFDAVIMDLTIPGGIGGKDAINKLIEIDPGVKAIVSSGYSNDPIMADFKKYGFRGVVAKPYTLEELSQVLYSLMKSSA